MHLIKKLCVRLVSVLPTNALRCAGYRLLGYSLIATRIGWRTRIETAGFSAKNCVIGARPLFAGPMTVTIGTGTAIGAANLFICGQWVQQYGEDRFPRRLQIGEHCLITGNHWFDVCGRLVLGDQTWIAGRESQFWTHGAGSSKSSITIGSRCYIGSAVRFAPGAAIGDDCVVGLGSVVVHAIDATQALIAGMPAKVVKHDYVKSAAMRVAGSTDE